MGRKTEVGVILLAGGVGSRMQSTTPKQFLKIKEKLVVSYSFELFISMREVQEIVVVCEPEYRQLFFLPEGSTKTLTFADPGKRRQDSVYHGFLGLKKPHELICVHDGARPFVTKEIVQRVMDGASLCGAATAGMPIKFTVKECDEACMVVNTPDRSRLWEIQTPQVIRYPLLKQGINHVYKENITVTDDVGFIEHLGLPVKVVEGSYRNIKITTPEDLLYVEMYTDF